MSNTREDLYISYISDAATAEEPKENVCTVLVYLLMWPFNGFALIPISIGKIEELDESRLLVAIVQSTRDLFTKLNQVVSFISTFISFSTSFPHVQHCCSSRLSVDRLHKSHFVLLYLDCL